MNQLSPQQLRTLARVRALRPHATVRWTGDRHAWTVEIVDPAAQHATPLFRARFARSGEVEMQTGLVR